MADKDEPTGEEGGDRKRPPKKKPEPPRMQIIPMSAGEGGGFFDAIRQALGDDSAACTCSRCRAALDDALPTGDDARAQINALRSLSALMDRETTFEAGNIVRAKAGLNISKLTTFAVVRKVLDEPMVNHEYGPESNLFNIPLDMIIGVMVNEGYFVEFYVDSRRYEVVPEEEIALL